MIGYNQKLVLLGIAAIVVISIGYSTLRYQGAVVNREAVASVFIGDAMASDYVRLDYGNCEFALNRDGIRLPGLKKRKKDDYNNCLAIAQRRTEAIDGVFDKPPTPETCYTYVKPKLQRPLDKKAGIAACRYFLNNEYG